MDANTNNGLLEFTQEQIDKAAILLAKQDKVDPSNPLNLNIRRDEIKRFISVMTCLSQVFEDPS